MGNGKLKLLKLNNSLNGLLDTSNLFLPTVYTFDLLWVTHSFPLWVNRVSKSQNTRIFIQRSTYPHGSIDI